MKPNAVLWTPDPDRVGSTAMYDFMSGQGFDRYDALYRWSIDQPEAFWESVCGYCGVHFDTPANTILANPGSIMHAGWFSGSRLNYAAHLLRHEGARPALIFCGENGVRRELTFDELRNSVAAIAGGLRDAGVRKGDRVAGFLPNCPETVIAMLAATSMGAVWSSCSPDFGVNGVVDRFGQIEPRVLFACDGYYYNGKQIDSIPVVDGIVAAIPSIRTTVVVPFLDQAKRDRGIKTGIGWKDFCRPDSDFEVTPVDFDHPLFIMFSSGTTGAPKCIVHGHGGTLLQHLKEHVLHTDIGPSDRVFYFTTCGWMMWNWLVSGLASGATLVLYDGSPFRDDGRALWSMAEHEKITIFGTSAKYISALQKSGLRPVDEFELNVLRTLLSTGSPLAPEGFDFAYDAIGKDICLSSIAGGTDIIGCFLIGNPILPVRRGELQCRGLGMAVEIFDDDGAPLVGEFGELVCTRPFPSAPVGFWNDAGDDRYRAAYFERFPGVWAHGDFALLTSEGGAIIQGRSDAVLNPGGVRIGTAEIYRQVEQLDEVVESIAIGQEWDNDVRVVLFVVLRSGITLDDELRDRIRRTVRENTSPRHVPAKIVAVPDIPRTKSGKIMELAVRAVVHGEGVKNTEALANPEALEYFRNIEELA